MPSILEHRAIQAQESGQHELAFSLWSEVLQEDSSHVTALRECARWHLHQGRAHAARSLIEQLTRLEPHHAQHWVNLAIACQQLNDDEGVANAITAALSRNPHDLLALVLKADLLSRQGKRHEAAATHNAVISVAPSLDRLPAELRAAVMHSIRERDRYNNELAEFLESRLAPNTANVAEGALVRFSESLGILTGKRKRFESQPLTYFYPGLIPQPFFRREQFDWLADLEASTSEIRAELLAILQSGTGQEAYLQYDEGLPLSQFAALNKSRNWSAIHLLKAGKIVKENAERCPNTMAILARLPQPDQPGRTPEAMFSILQPKTRIPAHTGASNSRVIVHLPLIVPPSCGFRVGPETREWKVGEAWVFDDTIEHEAWNMSSEPRAILIFDVWHPDLSTDERRMVKALAEGIQAFRANEDSSLRASADAASPFGL